MSMAESHIDSFSDRYWAAIPPDELVGVLAEKERKFQRSVRGSVYWERVLRNLAYFHGMFFESGTKVIDMALSLAGSQGEKLLFAANHFRNLLEHYCQLATRDKLGLKCRAINGDNKSLEQAKKGDGALDYYAREKKFYSYIDEACMHSLIFMQGLVTRKWNTSLGPIDPVTQKPMGDVELGNVLAHECVWNLSKPWSKKQWLILIDYRNKWDLVQLYPKQADEILKESDEKRDKLNIFRGETDLCDEDLVPVYEFYHAKTPAVPSGRYTLYVNETFLEDSQLPYEDIPVSRITPAEWMGQGTGWSPANSLQGPQEMLNGELSAIATNHAAAAELKIWLPEGSEKIKNDLLKGGVRVLSCAVKPEPLPMLQTPPEVFKFAQDIVNHMQLVCGITGATRGIAETGVTAASAFALFDAKSVQFATPFVNARNQLGEEVSTGLIRMLRQYGQNPRTLTIMGKENEPSEITFSGSDLMAVDRVVAEVINPMAKTLAGKDARAKDLISLGVIKTAEEYIEVQETGQLETAIKSESAELTLVHQENEDLIAGKGAHALWTDNHVLHIKEHKVVIADRRNRTNPAVVEAVLAHNMEHEALLADPACQRTMQALGYPVPPSFAMGMPMPPAPDGQGGPPGKVPATGREPADMQAKPPVEPPVQTAKQPPLPPGAPPQ